MSTLSTTADTDLLPLYAAVLNLDTEGEGEGAGAVLQDMEEEQYGAAYFVESLAAGRQGDNDRDWEMDPGLLKTIQGASKGVTERTDAEYRRYGITNTQHNQQLP
jgi:hypothetical protein